MLTKRLVFVLGDQVIGDQRLDPFGGGSLPAGVGDQSPVHSDGPLSDSVVHPRRLDPLESSAGAKHGIVRVASPNDACRLAGRFGEPRRNRGRQDAR